MRFGAAEGVCLRIANCFAMAYVKLVDVRRCPVGRGTFVEHGGRELAVFRFDAWPHVVVIDNACPHASGNLSGGEVCGRVVICPWHQWEFDLTTGVCVDSPRVRVVRYAAEVRDGFVFADLRALK